VNIIKKLIGLVLLFVLMGCATVNETKSVLIHPQQGETTIVVASKTTAKCQNIIGIITCDVNIDVSRVQ